MVDTGWVGVERGFGDADRPVLARMFWEAFSGKLARVMAPRPRALTFLEGALRPDFCLVARDRRGRALGAAGLKTRAGGLVGGGVADLARAYGLLGAVWRAPLLELTERPADPDALVLDGLFVAAAMRGRGVGTRLVAAVLAEAAARRYPEVRLDVIESNARARALYERLGFRATGVRRMGPAGLALGVAATTTMARPSVPPP
jgi:ribosomal protein S18 acetylase RimI-like enzyme